MKRGVGRGGGFTLRGFCILCLRAGLPPCRRGQDLFDQATAGAPVAPVTDALIPLPVSIGVAVETLCAAVGAPPDIPDAANSHVFFRVLSTARHKRKVLRPAHLAWNKSEFGVAVMEAKRSGPGGAIEVSGTARLLVLDASYMATLERLPTLISWDLQSQQRAPHRLPDAILGPLNDALAAVSYTCEDSQSLKWVGGVGRNLL